MRPISKNWSLLDVAAVVVCAAALTSDVRSQAADAITALQPSNPPSIRDVRWRRVGPELTALHELYTRHRATDSAQAFAPQVPYLRVAIDMVTIDAVADGDVAGLKSALASLGAVDLVAFKRVVSARLPLASIPQLANIQYLRFARPTRALTHVGNTTTQGDVAMNTDDARATFGLNGAGLTVGVLSDTFDCGPGTPGSYFTDILTTDLPKNIEVLDDTECDAESGDEGRAMLQLIHDVAPGAKLSFHTALGGQAGFALGIEELAGCPTFSEPGCKPAKNPADIVVDDVGYFATPMFQDGIIAQAVNVVSANGVPYFSAAGNSARASWEGGMFVSSGISPPGYLFPGDAHDFDDGSGIDIYQRVLLPPASTVVSFQWDQPFFSVSGAPGSANDIDFCIYPDPPPGAGPIVCSMASNVGADPVEVTTVTEPGAANVVIIKYTPAGGPNPGLMKYVAFNDGFRILDPYPMTMASTLFGQNNATGAVGVGAAFYFDTPEFGTDPALKETSSSAGGTPILFDIAGAPIFPPQVRLRPQIVAPDGTNTTFFGADIPDPGDGSDLDSFPNFFGTSAAAPHAAAIAALMLEASPDLTPSGVEDVMTSSAREQDMGVPGFDFDTGWGLTDGYTAVGSVDDSGGCDGVEFLSLSGKPNSGPGTFSANQSIAWGDGRFNDVTGLAPLHIFMDGFESGDTSSWSNTCP